MITADQYQELEKIVQRYKIATVSLLSKRQSWFSASKRVINYYVPALALLRGPNGESVVSLRHVDQLEYETGTQDTLLITKAVYEKIKSDHAVWIGGESWSYDTSREVQPTTWEVYHCTEDSRPRFTTGNGLEDMFLLGVLNEMKRYDDGVRPVDRTEFSKALGKFKRD
jgi:hypothetical protein